MRGEVAMASNDVAARNHGSQRRHRSAVSSQTTEPLSLGFAAQHRAAGRSEKSQSLWRAARIVSVYPVRKPKAPVGACRESQIPDITERLNHRAADPSGGNHVPGRGPFESDLTAVELHTAGAALHQVHNLGRHLL